MTKSLRAGVQTGQRKWLRTCQSGSPVRAWFRTLPTVVTVDKKIFKKTGVSRRADYRLISPAYPVKQDLSVAKKYFTVVFLYK